MHLLYNFGYNIDFSSTYYQYTVLMVFLNCTVNPFVYLFKYKEYQKALRELVRCGRDSQRRAGVSTVSSHLQSV